MVEHMSVGIKLNMQGLDGERETIWKHYWFCEHNWSKYICVL